MKSLRRLIACSFLLLSMLSTSCTAWTVVSQATPNPFLGKKDFAVAPLKFSSTPQEDDPQRKANLARDMEGMRPIFANTLRDVGAKAGFNITQERGAHTIFADVTTIELGSFWTGFSQVNMSVELRSSDGKVLDRITIDQRVNINDNSSSLRGNETVVRGTGGRVTTSSSGPTSVADVKKGVKMLNSGYRIQLGAQRIAEIIVDYLKERTTTP